MANLLGEKLEEIGLRIYLFIGLFEPFDIEPNLYMIWIVIAVIEFNLIAILTKELLSLS